MIDMGQRGRNIRSGPSLLFPIRFRCAARRLADDKSFPRLRVSWTMCCDKSTPRPAISYTVRDTPAASEMGTGQNPLTRPDPTHGCTNYQLTEML